MIIVLLLIAIGAVFSILLMSWIIYHAGKEIGWQTGFHEGNKVGINRGHEEGYREAVETAGDWYAPRPAGR